MRLLFLFFGGNARTFRLPRLSSLLLEQTQQRTLKHTQRPPSRLTECCNRSIGSGCNRARRSLQANLLLVLLNISYFKLESRSRSQKEEARKKPKQLESLRDTAGRGKETCWCYAYFAPGNTHARAHPPTKQPCREWLLCVAFRRSRRRNTPEWRDTRYESK